MKFAQYLQDTQTPEWKRAYIDYRGLKKRITAIRKAQQGLSFHVSSEDSPVEGVTPPLTPRPSDVSDRPPTIERATRPRRGTFVSERVLPSSSRADLAQEGEGNSSPVTHRRRPSFAIASMRLSFKNSRLGTVGSLNKPINPLAALPLHELLSQLSPHEVSFFTMLDAQLDKVESFYVARETEMTERGRLLQIQLNELSDHRRLFLEAHSQATRVVNLVSAVKRKLKLTPDSKDVQAKASVSKLAKEPATIKASSSKAALAKEPSDGKATLDEVPELGSRKVSYHESINTEISDVPEDDIQLPLSPDPDNYLAAKAKLKRAVLEHYRGLELLHNFRVLNITGFRKALKKFEKVTRIPVQNQYMTEKVERSAFTSDKSLKEMMTRMEEMYASSFAGGDKKRAMRRLRSGNMHKNHHFSTFRTGIMIGLAIPALADGLVKVFQSSTRENIPAWDALLFVYAVILIPVLFSILVGVNLLVWAQARINYVFIFELDVLTRLDHREYFELPSLLLCTLIYAFWLSFSNIGTPHMDPTIWPLVWLAFAVILLFSPLSLFFRSARYWLVRNVGGLFLSGSRPVEFTDFWLGDQFCSLVFTLSNLFLCVCVYVDGFSVEWHKCGSTNHLWPVAYVLASLPLFIRFVQSVKRFKDSGLSTHLINAGKYGSGIIAYLFYFLWRHDHETHGPMLILWVFFNTLYSLYAGSWDLLMDWSLLRPRSKNPYLRDELVYSSHVYVYYFAIISNCILRFVWIIYIPQGGANMMAKTFIAGFLEMLRRWQWNFFRLENEHLGNMDQYRVTREVPLPYEMHTTRGDDDDDDDGEERKFKTQRKRR